MNVQNQSHNLVYIARAALSICALCALVGCGAIKNSLKPWVCDCEPEKLACADGSTPEAIAAQEPEDTDESEPIESEEGPSDEEKRRRALLESSDFVATDSRRPQTDSSLEKLESDFGLRSELSKDHAVFVGPMAKDGQNSLAVLKPGDEIKVFVDGGRDAERDWKTTLASQSWVEALEKTADAARMIDDGRLELVVQEIHENEDGTARIELAVYKVIGIAVARVFAQPVADRAEDGSWEKTHEVRILNGERARWIEVTPVGSGEPAIFRWNHWEGMFRVPRPVPTAPRKQETQKAKQPVSQRFIAPGSASQHSG